MLSQESITIVKSTAPILEAHGEALTKHFYQRMFTHNPEVAPFFNPINQQSGSQQRALATAVTAYAANIDNLAALGGAVELIAQKHASLQIKPEHYPIVGANLLASIKEVLGEGATDAVINAWAEAYGVLADILINREQQIYTDNSAKVDGWEGFRSFRIERKEVESDVITSFYLKPSDGGGVPNFAPGQYITVRVPTSDGQTTMRNYSLSDKPGHEYFRISVKKEDGPDATTPKGFVSNLLHDTKSVGDTVEVAPPCGEFVLDVTKDTDKPLVLMAAGVGITPIMSMLEAALAANPNRPIAFLYGCLNETVEPFKTVVDDLDRKHANLTVHRRYSENSSSDAQATGTSSSGFIDADLIEATRAGADADYYFCGPKAFMANTYQILSDWQVPASQVHFEFFGPLEDLQS